VTGNYARSAAHPGGQPDPPPQPGTPASQSVTAQLCQAAATVRAHIERVALRPHAITWTGFTVLRFVVHHPGSQPQRVAAMLQLPNPTLTAVLHPLIKRGLIRRDRDPHDGRCAMLVATREGSVLAHRLTLTVIAEETRLLAAPAHNAGTVARLVQWLAYLHGPGPTPPAARTRAPLPGPRPGRPGPTPDQADRSRPPGTPHSSTLTTPQPSIRMVQSERKPPLDHPVTTRPNSHRQAATTGRTAPDQRHRTLVR
jgi:MarR family transcriptional regulator, organic hydroperoxide resistance regulator